MTTQRIYFPKNDCYVLVSLSNKGQHVARLEEEPLVRGYGHSVLSAIADLVEATAKAEAA